MYVLLKKIYMCVCVCERERDNSQVFHSLISVWPHSFHKNSPGNTGPLLGAPDPTPSECTGEYSSTARRAAVTCVRGGANLNRTFQIWTIFSHPCTAYRQLKFCVQSLLDRLCKHAKFQARFRPDKPDHSLVRPLHAFDCTRFDVWSWNDERYIITPELGLLRHMQAGPVIITSRRQYSC
jgi:hypothetical protein